MCAACRDALINIVEFIGVIFLIGVGVLLTIKVKRRSEDVRDWME